MSKETLARNIGLGALIVYGIGDMVGAGIYGTIGVAAGTMGNAVWLAFIAAMVVALLTGLSYASLGSKYPRAGGASFITQEAYRSQYLSFMVGLAVTASGLISMAAGTNVFKETLAFFIPEVPKEIIVVSFLGLLTLINLAGIKESISVNIFCTAIEVLGLIFIICIGAKYWGSVNYFEVPSGASFTPMFLLSGAVLTFYAFIGFEDMLNVGEEVKEAEKNVPLGIIFALVITTILYIAVSITAVSVVPPSSLADATKGSPLSQITQVAAPWLPGSTYSFITLFAVANTALLNFVMASRMIFGMAREGLLPHWLSGIHQKRKTPHRAILVLSLLVLVLAFSGNIGALASATSLLLLLCFCIINGALIVITLRDKVVMPFSVPIVVPFLGLISSMTLIGARVSTTAQDSRAVIIAGTVLVVLTVLYLLQGRARKKL